MKNKNQGLKKIVGFTIIELMIIVGILAVLAAVAIPAYVTYMKRSKSSEAAVGLKAICKGTAAYFTMEIKGSTNRQPANATQTPAQNPSAIKYTLSEKLPEFTNAAQANGPTWLALGWSPHADFYYAYSYNQDCGTSICSETLGNGMNGVARGDLDGDGIFSLYTRFGAVKDGQMTCGDLIVANAVE